MAKFVYYGKDGQPPKAVTETERGEFNERARRCFRLTRKNWRRVRYERHAQWRETITHSLSPHRAYGAVYKALHKESSQLLAIKQVPVDADLQDIIKEISIMQQCDR